jgi:hypothetical protein
MRITDEKLHTAEAIDDLESARRMFGSRWVDAVLAARDLRDLRKIARKVVREYDKTGDVLPQTIAALAEEV